MHAPQIEIKVKTMRDSESGGNKVWNEMKLKEAVFT